MNEVEVREEVQRAERALDELGERERRLWDRMYVEPSRWKQEQYPGYDPFWVVAILGRRCLYLNHMEGGWGWGRFDTWGVVSEYHCQDGEIQHAVYQALLAIDHGGQG
jgi:hypothetical protein